MPGPTLLMQLSAAVKFVSKLKPSMEMRKAAAAITRK